MTAAPHLSAQPNSNNQMSSERSTDLPADGLMVSFPVCLHQDRPINDILSAVSKILISKFVQCTSSLPRTCSCAIDSAPFMKKPKAHGARKSQQMVEKITTGSRFYSRTLHPRRVRTQPQTWAPNHFPARPSQTPQSAEGGGVQTPTSFKCPMLFASDILKVSRYEFGRNPGRLDGNGGVWTKVGVTGEDSFPSPSAPEAQRKSGGQARSVGCTAPLATAPRQAEYSTLEKWERERERERERQRGEGGRQSQESGSSYPYNTKRRSEQIEGSAQWTERLETQRCYFRLITHRMNMSLSNCTSHNYIFWHELNERFK